MNVTHALEEILKEGVWVGGEMVGILYKVGEFIVGMLFGRERVMGWGS